MLLNNQRQLFGTRRAGLQSDIQGLREAIESAKTQGETARLMAQQRQRQLDLLREELSNIRELVSDGYVPRNRQLELERMSADIQASIAELTGNAIRAERTIAELTQRIQSRNAEYRKDVESQLADIAREVQADAKKYLAEKASLQRTELRSPTSGQVVGLMVQTIGAVIQPGEKLMDVVPDKQRLLLETKVPPHLIDKVHADLLADIRFNTFAHSPQLVIPGRVLSVSGDLMVDPQNPQFGYFLARIEVTPDGIQALGNRQLQPGMPVEVLIRTGERSLLQYLLHPLTKRIASAMKEE
jgi:protease secretion system membrane fusion protein